MGINHVAAALAVSCSCTFVIAACVQSPTAPETEAAPTGDAPSVETKDDDDPGWEDPEASFSRLVLCLALTTACPEAKEAFCRSQPEPDVRARCFANARESRNKWAGWCRNGFGS